MAYQVLARKWRPARFEDVVGQQMVTQALKNAIEGNRIAHAFLFSGVRGVGKTTTARILAKALNCHQGLTATPCGECPSCTEISTSSSVDVLEIDAASNTGIDNIREIRDSVQYGTARDRFKVFIIDEVHMLSKGAFNALLKTLEEPPAHVKFVLATTELHKIPVTITSRCQQYDFRPIPLGEILERMRLICSEEGITVSDYGLRSIASVARGSLRDAQSTLDKVISLSGSEIRDEDIRTLLGVVDEKILASLIEALANRDQVRLLEELRNLSESGIEADNFCLKLIGYFRNLLVCKVAGWDSRLIEWPEAEREILETQSQHFSEMDLIRFYDLLNRTAYELRSSAHPAIHLEMALVKLIEVARLPRLEEVIRQFQDPSTIPQGQGPAPSPPAARPRGVTSPPQPAAPRVVARTPVQEEERKPDPVAGRFPVNDGQVVEALNSALQNEAIRLYTSIQQASTVGFENNRLRIVFPAGEAFHAAVVREPDNQKVLVDLCARICGRPVEVLAELESVVEDKAMHPEEEPRIKEFLELFPGKISVERKREE